jgi:CRISPR/Cas system CMR subunit Cmr4 (Cas7 group RAMP superfamily)
MYNWIVAPHVNCLSAAQAYNWAVNKAVEKNKAASREIKTKTKKLEELNQQIAISRGALFTPDEAKKFLSNLQTISEEAGCTVRSLNIVMSTPSSKNKKKQHKGASVGIQDNSGIVSNSAMLTVTGEYNSIVRLVEKLQNQTKRIWMDSFKIETISSDPAQLKCDITIIVYTIGNEEAAL